MAMMRRTNLLFACCCWLLVSAEASRTTRNRSVSSKHIVQGRDPPNVWSAPWSFHHEQNTRATHSESSLMSQDPRFSSRRILQQTSTASSGDQEPENGSKKNNAPPFVLVGIICGSILILLMLPRIHRSCCAASREQDDEEKAEGDTRTMVGDSNHSATAPIPLSISVQPDHQECTQIMSFPHQHANLMTRIDPVIDVDEETESIWDVNPKGNAAV